MGQPGAPGSQLSYEPGLGVDAALFLNLSVLLT
jgi:hypothetical protein